MDPTTTIPWPEPANIGLYQRRGIRPVLNILVLYDGVSFANGLTTGNFNHRNDYPHKSQQ
jgi:hypothetical protein